MLPRKKSDREVMKRPWNGPHPPLMLAPMQGLTNRAMRAVQCDIGQPDVVFTEFVRVSHVARQRITRSDRREVLAGSDDVPLVVQLIGHTPEALAQATQQVEKLGARHLNLNMGCPFGRTTSGKTGGAMLQQPELIEACLDAVVREFSGSVSVKVRSGYDDPEQIFSLLPLFERSGVDFIVLHPRTVVQKYQGLADHAITARVVAATTLPVIANGDIVSAEQGLTLLEESGAAGLMLGRGAIANPWLFAQLRRQLPQADEAQRYRQSCDYLNRLAEEYQRLFCGEHQALGKLKSVLECFSEPGLLPLVKKLRRCKTLPRFLSELQDVGEGE
jgi:tRNA-dihydrouridine synthase